MAKEHVVADNPASLGMTEACSLDNDGGYASLAVINLYQVIDKDQQGPALDINTRSYFADHLWRWLSDFAPEIIDG